MSISTVVKSVQDIMRQDAGVDGDAQRVSQLVWMLFIKVFDAKEEEWELMQEVYKPVIPQGLRWRDWAANDEGITGDELLDFVNNTLFRQLKELPVDEFSEPRAWMVKNLFEDAYNYMKSGTLMRQVINKLNEIDFTRQSERHLFNDIYETILRALQSAGNAGEYYTPRPVTQFIVDMVNPQLGETVLDPACGTGGFLICALENLKKHVSNIEDREQLQKSIIGIEKKPLPYLLAVTNMILHDVDKPRIQHDNSLSTNVRDYKQKDRVDVIITNPPFGGTEEDGIEMSFPQQFRTRETADLFLVLMMYRLKENGRAGMVLPDGFLFGEGVKTKIKEKLLEEFNLHTIVRLPRGVFAPYTDINTNLLFFEKGQPTKEIWCFEHPLPVERQGKPYNKTQPIKINEFDLEKTWWSSRQETHYAWKVSIDEIRKRNYNLDFKNPKALIEEKLEKPENIFNRILKRQEEISHILSAFRREIDS
jgi:type I restriction enzyme M protein